VTTVASSILPLDNGDRLTRAEFHARYEQHPEIRRAELIEGVVYVPSPVGIDHSQRDGHMMRWISAYVGDRADLSILPNATVRIDADNEVQPDISLMRMRPDELGKGRYVERAPELVVEIAGSTVSYDLHDKMNVYRRNGVQEYIVWRVYDRAIDWFELKDGRYERLEADAGGVIESHVFPGLRLAVEKMLAGDLAAVLAEQQREPAE
jgi:Uma2 family endonuclease